MQLPQTGFTSFSDLELNDQLMFTFHQIQRSIDSAFKPPEILWPLGANHTYCAHFGKKPTAEEAKEERDLLSSIAWPGPLVQGLPVELSSDPAKSYFVILGSSKKHKGGQLLVNVHMQNFLGLPKDHGGDFLIARLHSPRLGAGVAGKVHDHQDGTYTVMFPLLWTGVAWVEITMVHPSEAVMVLKRLQEEQPDRVFFKSVFSSGTISETTMCNLCLPLNEKPLCNYTDPETGEPWYCYKPQHLGCDTRINHSKGGYKKNLITEYEAQFFQSGVNLKIPIPAAAMDKVTILPEKKDLTHLIPYSPKKTGPYLAVDRWDNILVSYRCHGPPIRFTSVLSSELGYVANELDKIQGGPRTVVLVSVWSHFSTFPIEVYIRRLRHIRRAVLQLLAREPDTVVVIRTANLQKIGPESSLFNSDWFSLQRDAVLRAMFKGIHVQLIDAWEMTLAHHLPHDIHPPLLIIENMIDLILSHICPVREI
ncbi:NXPE family member 3 precursor [Silurus meridionalis]|nr:NXPE family member 3 precursor [Silurus meridionalis]